MAAQTTPVPAPTIGVRRPRRLRFLAAALLMVIFFGLYSAGRHLWAEFHLQAAHKDLERWQFASARSHLDKYLQVWPDNAEIHLLAARTARRNRDYDDAARLLSQYRKLGGNAEFLRLERTLALAQRGDVAAQERYLWALIAESPDEAPFALEALAQGYMQSFRWADAITTLDRLLDVWPQRADLYVWRGWVQEKLLRIDHATKDYRKAVELSPNTDEARLRLGEALVATSNFEEAADHLEQVRQRRPDDSAVLLGLSRCRTELLQLDEAGQLLDRLLALKPRAAAALTQRGKWEMKRGRLDKAEDWLRQSLALAPAERETNYQLALCLRQRGKAAEADACLARLKQIERDQDRLAELYGEMVKKPRDLALRREAGVILLNNGQADEGIRVLQSVLDEDAGNGPAHAALADYYQRTGNRALAERHRRRAQ